MDTFLPAIIGGIVGGITVLVGLGFLLRFQLRGGGADFMGFSVEQSKDYKDVTLLDHEIRTGGMWVRIENSGDLVASFVSLRMSLFAGQRLVAQHDLMTPPIPAGQISEFVMPIVDDQREPVEVGDCRYELSIESCHANV